MSGLPILDKAFWKQEHFDENEASASELIEQFQYNCDYIMKNSDREPCMELAAIENRNQLILNKIAKFSTLIGNLDAASSNYVD